MNPQERLRRFVAVVDALSNLGRYPRCLEGVTDLSIDVSSDGKPMPAANVLGCDTDLLRSYIISFRRFTLEGDDCNLTTVLNAARIVFQGSWAEKRLRTAMERISCVRKRGYPLSLEGDWPTLKPEEMFKIWIYGTPSGFHFDPERKEYQQWKRFGELPSGHAHLTSMVLQYIRSLDREVHHLRKLFISHI